MIGSDKQLLIINYAYESKLKDPEALLDTYFMLPAWVNACSQAGIKVTVFQRFKTSKQMSINGVQYFFIQDTLPEKPSYYHCAWRFNRIIHKHVKTIKETAKPDQICLHINGLIFPVSVMHLTRSLGHSVYSVVQHHAESPRSKLFCLLNRIANTRIKHFFFTTKSHAVPWVETRSLVESKVVELMECSSNCKPQNKQWAKEKLGKNNGPLLLWAGNLNKNKDPLTILSGFEQFLLSYPKASLFMLFRDAELIVDVKKLINNSEKLRNAVSLIGKIDYNSVDDYYNAADIFVQGSAREGSGVAVLDALACGAIPVITIIPSFVSLTENGSVGALWSRGQADQFVKALLQVMSHDLPLQQQACRDLYERRWSISKLASHAIEYYFS